MRLAVSRRRAYTNISDAISKADTRYLIADSSKIGRRDFYTFCRLDNLNAVVCEPGITAEDRTAIEEHTQVIC